MVVAPGGELPEFVVLVDAPFRSANNRCNVTSHSTATNSSNGKQNCSARGRNAEDAFKRIGGTPTLLPELIEGELCNAKVEED